MGTYVLPVYIRVCHMQTVPSKVRRGHPSPQDWSYSACELPCGSGTRTWKVSQCSPNHSAISPALRVLFQSGQKVGRDQALPHWGPQAEFWQEKRGPAAETPLLSVNNTERTRPLKGIQSWATGEARPEPGFENL